MLFILSSNSNPRVKLRRFNLFLFGILGTDFWEYLVFLGFNLQESANQRSEKQALESNSIVLLMKVIMNSINYQYQLHPFSNNWRFNIKEHRKQ